MDDGAKTAEQIQRELAAPFGSDDIEWRIGRCGKKNDKPWAKCLAYVNSTSVKNRLDAVVGAFNWRNEYQPGPAGGIMCGISIRVPGGDGEWVTKWDGAENTDIESVKGGFSDAMKRAVVQWGPGRELYKLEEAFTEASWVQTDVCHKYAKDKTIGVFFWAIPDIEAERRKVGGRQPGQGWTDEAVDAIEPPPAAPSPKPEPDSPPDGDLMDQYGHWLPADPLHYESSKTKGRCDICHEWFDPGANIAYAAADRRPGTEKWPWTAHWKCYEEEVEQASKGAINPAPKREGGGEPESQNPPPKSAKFGVPWDSFTDVNTAAASARTFAKQLGGDKLAALERLQDAPDTPDATKLLNVVAAGKRWELEAAKKTPPVAAGPDEDDGLPF